MNAFWQLCLAGILNGGLYGAFALCFALVHRISRVVNFALGDFAMVGALGTSLLVEQHGAAMWWGLLAMLAIAGAIAYLFHRVILEPAFARRTDFVTIFLLTFALSMMLEGAGVRVFGPDVHSVPAILNGSVVLGKVTASKEGFILLAVAVFIAVCIGVWLRSTLFGKAMTACGDSEAGARVSGINVRRFQRMTFVAAAIIAAGFGVLYAPLSSFTYQTGFGLGLTGLLAATLAGMNSPLYGFGIGVGVGVIEQLIGGYVTTGFEDAVLYGLLALLLVWRPQLVPST
jgi:branched-chain amino acid transport system permease protein